MIAHTNCDLQAYVQHIQSRVMAPCLGPVAPKSQMFELWHIALRQAAFIQPACPLQSEEEALVARQQSGAHASTTGNDDNAEHELQTADTLEVSGSLVQVGLLHTARPMAVMPCTYHMPAVPHRALISHTCHKAVSSINLPVR